jgi:hypothetical protein
MQTITARKAEKILEAVATDSLEDKANHYGDMIA